MDVVAREGVTRLVDELRSWPAYASENRDLIRSLKIAASVAPDPIKKSLARSARIRMAFIWMSLLMMIFLLSLIGSTFSVYKVANTIIGFVTLGIIIYAAIRSAKRSTRELLDWIESDDPDDATGISPSRFPVTAGVVFAPWIRQRNGILGRLGMRLGNGLKRYIGVR